MPLDPQAQAHLERLAATGFANFHLLPPPEVRAGMQRMSRALGQPEPVADVKDRTIDTTSGELRIRMYHPAPGETLPVIVFFHGGGFVLGSLDTHDGLARSLANGARSLVVSVDYPLAPEHKYPAARTAAFAATRWIADHAAELGGDATRLAVAGDSAGGNLAALVALRSRDEGIGQPALQVLLYPSLDLSAETRSRILFSDGFFLSKQDMDWFKELYLDGAGLAADDARVSPLKAADLSGLAPALVLTAGFDPLRDEGNEYATALRSAGVSVDHRQFDALTHGFASLAPFGGGSADAIAATISAIRAHLSRG